MVAMQMQKTINGCHADAKNQVNVSFGFYV